MKTFYFSKHTSTCEKEKVNIQFHHIPNTMVDKSKNIGVHLESQGSLRILDCNRSPRQIAACNLHRKEGKTIFFSFSYNSMIQTSVYSSFCEYKLPYIFELPYIRTFVKSSFCKYEVWFNRDSRHIF